MDSSSVTISTDQNLLDVDLIHDFLSRHSYWAQGRSREVVERSLRNSLCFGAYRDGRQLGFARVVTDRATFGWLCDVFVVPEARGLGISKSLMEAVLGHPELQGFRRFLLATKDAHSLYAQFGFEPLSAPERWMSIERF
ncbi:MAG: GNAT family N-acetyltransferase [Bryobacteraceae bacterium]|nr:GNAT family N-acetyltransferase [Bryobacteraceae bacterium]